MENFTSRAIAWAKANRKTSVIYNSRNYIAFSHVASWFSYHKNDEQLFFVGNRPLTEVIIEWENSLKNKMPELEAGMILVIDYKYEDEKNIEMLYINNQHLLGENGTKWSSGLENAVVHKIYSGVEGGFDRQFDALDDDRLIWQRTDPKIKQLEDLIEKLSGQLEETKGQLLDIKG